MAISSTANRVSAAGNGVTTAFSFPYKFIKNADLVVILRVELTGVETTKTLTTHYTVTGAGSESGGTITMLTAPPTGTSFIAYRDPAATQEVDLVENDPLPAETVEDEFDKLTMLIQRLDDRMDRSAALTDGYTGTFDPRLPSLLEADATLIFNPTATGWAVGPTTTEIEDAEENAAAAAASAAAAAASETLAEQWASLTTAQVAATDNSSKSWAIGGTGAGQPAAGPAKDWATKTTATVDGADYSAKEWAKGTQTRGAASGGSSKDWANYTGGTVDNTEYSSKKYAQDAATSAAIASSAAASIIFNDVVFLTFADSPRTITSADRGKYFSCDATGGNIVINLPQISGLDLSTPFVLGVKKSDASANTITMNRAGTDLIDAATSYVLAIQNVGVLLDPDVSPSPDVWTTSQFGDALTLATIPGTLAINKGGTGQTTQTAAFDALSPLTTKGDLLTRDGSNNVALAAGTNGYVLVADSTQTKGLRWGDPAATTTDAFARLLAILF